MIHVPLDTCLVIQFVLLVQIEKQLMEIGVLVVVLVAYSAQVLTRVLYVEKTRAFKQAESVRAMTVFTWTSRQVLARHADSNANSVILVQINATCAVQTQI